MDVQEFRQHASECRIDDVAEPLPNHGSVGGLHTVDDATQVHRNDPMPGIDGVIRDLACKNNAGIVEDVVNAAELLHRLGHKFTDSSKVAHIEMPGGSAAALLTDLRGSRFRVAEVDVREDDLAATLRKSLGDCSPDPGRRAGH